MLITVNHTGITVKNLDRSEAMFRDLFGFKTFSRASRDPAIISAVTGVDGAEVEIVYMRNGAVDIELLCYSAPTRRHDHRPRPCDLGSLHIAMNVEDMDLALKNALSWPLEIIGKEVQIDAGPNTGARIIYMRNPEDGLIIEMIQRPT
jgi:catechol 2,3-dioxygenase-like lactoylglutathione lyase family enzyme|tara:strand:+ start:16 stop:459 length:444 start_codon:yes stop_codon:yes gene_type:complete